MSENDERLALRAERDQLALSKLRYGPSRRGRSHTAATQRPCTASLNVSHAYTAALQAYSAALHAFHARVGPLDPPP